MSPMTLKTHPNTNGQRLAIAASVIVHVAVLLFLFAVPAQKVGPHIEAIQVHFAELKTRPVKGNAVYKSAALPKQEQQQSAGAEKSKVAPPDAGQAIKAAVLGERADAAIGLTRETTNKNKAAGTGTAEAGSMPSGSMPAAKPGAPAVRETRFGDTGAPAFLHREAPIYPLLAQRMGKEGRVLLKLSIDAGGQLKHIEVVESSWSGFTDAAVAAVQKSRFTPAYKDGHAVASRALLSVRFNLRKGA